MTRLAVAVLAALAGCATQPAARTTTCPPCECHCNPGSSGAAATPGGSAQAAADHDAALVLSKSAMKKMNFKDGPGCLADLDELKRVSPKLEDSFVYTRGLCEMLAGRCQQGKQRVTDYLQGETNMHPDRARASTEAMAAMYCQGGDASDRDRLLGALQELTTAAYSETRTVEQCKTTLATVQSLVPRVKPRDDEDTQVINAGKSLWTIAPNCFARAGDCAAAWSVFKQLYPMENLKEVKDPKVRDEAVTTSFDAIVTKCKGKR